MSFYFAPLHVEVRTEHPAWFSSPLLVEWWTRTNPRRVFVSDGSYYYSITTFDASRMISDDASVVVKREPALCTETDLKRWRRDHPYRVFLSDGNKYVSMSQLDLDTLYAPTIDAAIDVPFRVFGYEPVQ